jgi:6-phosphogluconolactonase
MSSIKIVVGLDPVATAQAAATDIAKQLTIAANARGVATLAVSGGSTPALLFDALATLDVPWEVVHIFQVDERIVAAGHPDRNLGQLQAHLLTRVPIPEKNCHAMPVELGTAGLAARTYASLLKSRTRGILDIVHLGLGDDGHTASLVPGDAVLHVTKSLVATTQRYKGRRRITLTYKAIHQARSIVWLATGAAKISAVKQLIDQDPSIPAGCVKPGGANTLYIDRDAQGDGAR